MKWESDLVDAANLTCRSCRSIKAPACAGAFALRDDQLADAIVSAVQSDSGGGHPTRDGGRHQTMRHWITSFRLLEHRSSRSRGGNARPFPAPRLSHWSACWQGISATLGLPQRGVESLHRPPAKAGKAENCVRSSETSALAILAFTHSATLPQFAAARSSLG